MKCQRCKSKSSPPDWWAYTEENGKGLRICATCVLKDFRRIEVENQQLKEDLKEARELAFDLFNQACRVHTPIEGKVYDHCCMSTFEEAQEYLLEHDLIKRQECIRLED